MKKKWIAIAAIALIVLIGIIYGLRRRSSIPQSHEIVIRISDTRFMGILPLYVAEEKGFFKQQGLTINWSDVRDPGQAEKLFTSGQSDLMMTTFANLLSVEVRQPGSIHILFPIYESSDKPGSYILVKPDSSIKTIQDLRGKSLGTYSGPSQKGYALIVLRKLGLREPEDVRLVQVASSAQVQSLFGGAYDALFTVEPYGSTAISQGARVIDSGVRTKYITNPFWLGSVAVSASLAKQQPQRVNAILNALEQASKYIVEHDAEAREILARRTGIEGPVAQRSALYTWVAHPSKQDIMQIQEHVDLLVKEKLLDKSVDVSAILDGAR